ncbi:MAG TPA: prenyltransferase/squalene oxidase repeat-containing protein, partial [Pirellulales bacterium]|nr:prenyltransferase/squalene oxidase repeat-containing protein [Pirellulales bacterium]
MASSLRRGILYTQQWLLAQQHADGHWVGELEGDTILESEYILLLAHLGRHATQRARKAAQYILDKQSAGGGWSLYPGGPVDVSSSVKAYFALKLTGHDPAAEPLQRARAAILAHGGADAVNSFTRFYLALLGQISYNECPVVPPEMVLVPKWFPLNLHSVSAWSRTIIVPLAIMSACRPTTEIDPRLGIRELFLRSPDQWPPLRCPGLSGSTGLLSWDRIFRTLDRVLKFNERNSILPLRRRALQAAERWVLERFDGSDGLGAIFPPMIWSVIALRALGYSDDSPQMRYCHERLDGLLIEEHETIRLQPCKSPVWDTAIALRALADSGLGCDHEAVERAVDWLLKMQITRPGDWSARVDAQPAAWCFEYANDYYPDCDDTAMVLMALVGQFSESSGGMLPPELQVVGERRPAEDTTADRGDLLPRSSQAIAGAERWLLAMQNRDGGWGAFDRDNDQKFLCHVPFADHNAMIDPSTPDLAARVIEALGKLGHRVGHPAIDRAIAYLRRSQEADGSWFGRWGVNYVYGTWQVLTGLAAVGLRQDDPLMVAGANWLLAYQQASGGWGESADSYAHPHRRGQGPVTASQTAWGVLGLLAAGLTDHPAVESGVRYLLETQQADGTWDEPEFT